LAAGVGAAGEEGAAARVFLGFNVVVISRLSVVSYSLYRFLDLEIGCGVVKSPKLSIWFKNE
jgi:hypothetical protein